jgi:hypothetical protein
MGDLRLGQLTVRERALQETAPLLFVTGPCATLHNEVETRQALRNLMPIGQRARDNTADAVSA